MCVSVYYFHFGGFDHPLLSCPRPSAHRAREATAPTARPRHCPSTIILLSSSPLSHFAESLSDASSCTPNETCRNKTRRNKTRHTAQMAHNADSSRAVLAALDVCWHAQVSRMLGAYIKGSNHGALLAWGTATSFQLGLGEKAAWGLGGGGGQKKPTLVGQVPTDAALVATSNMHTVVVTAGGAVWTSGVGGGGRLGLGTNSSQAVFRQVVSLGALRVTAVAVSDNHSLAVIDSGAAYAWGCNKSGQLGLGPPGGKGAQAVGLEELAPRRLLLLNKTRIVSVAAALQHSVLVSEPSREAPRHARVERA